MSSEETPFTARVDFPVKRMLRMLVLSNMMTSGALYLIGLCGNTIERAHHQFSRYGDLPGFESLYQSMKIFNRGTLKTFSDFPVILLLPFGIGGLVAMTWYVVARRIETREMKKRWLILQKQQTSENG